MRDCCDQVHWIATAIVGLSHRVGPFLYKPKAKVQVNAMDTPVAHVSVRVPYVLRMQVENPLDLPLTLKNLELRTDALEIKSEVLSEIVLPPLSKKSMLLIVRACSFSRVGYCRDVL